MSEPAVYIVDGCRTPFLRAHTGFESVLPHDLLAAPLSALLRRNELPPDAIDVVIAAHTVQELRTTNVARDAMLAAGYAPGAPAYTVTAGGAAGGIALQDATRQLRAGCAELAVIAGVDVLSRVLKTMSPREHSTGQTMLEYTESLAIELAVSRAEQDAFANRSHQLAAAAASKLAPDVIPIVKPSGTVTTDNGIRPNTSPEKLATLPPVLGRDKTITAGNASFLTDGASAVLLASEAAVTRHSLRPIARVRADLVTGHDLARHLLLGPAFAIPRLLNSQNLATAQVQVFELHEAFAAQVLSVIKLLSDRAQRDRFIGPEPEVGPLEAEKLNRWGGSLAIGNPFSPTVARLAYTAARRLHDEKGRVAAVSTCSGGGFGFALLLERV